MIEIQERSDRDKEDLIETQGRSYVVVLYVIRACAALRCACACVFLCVCVRARVRVWVVGYVYVLRDSQRGVGRVGRGGGEWVRVVKLRVVTVGIG